MSEVVTQSSLDDVSPPGPTEILLTVLLTFLTPMFLTGSGGDLRLARAAALETVSGYRARNSFDLLTVVQLVACGICALGSLALSMGDGLSLSMVLRLRTNASTLSRAAEKHRRALETSHGPSPPANDDAEPQYWPPGEEQLAREARVKEAVRAAQARAREAAARLVQSPVSPASVPPVSASPKLVSPREPAPSVSPAGKSHIAADTGPARDAPRSVPDTSGRAALVTGDTISAGAAPAAKSSANPVAAEYKSDPRDPDRNDRHPVTVPAAGATVSSAEATHVSQTTGAAAADAAPDNEAPASKDTPRTEPTVPRHSPPTAPRAAQPTAPRAMPPTAAAPIARNRQAVAEASAAPASSPMPTEQQWRTLWADAMAVVAGEYAASLDDLPPEERRLAAIRAEALTGAANQLLGPDPLPASPLAGLFPGAARPAT